MLALVSVRVLPLSRTKLSLPLPGMAELSVMVPANVPEAAMPTRKVAEVVDELSTTPPMPGSVPALLRTATD